MRLGPCHTIFSAVLLLILVLSASSAMADPKLELMRFQTDDKATLNALYYSPDRDSKSLFILIPGLFGGILGGGHDYKPLADELTAKGYAVMLLNMRTAANFPFATFDSAKDDIAAAIKTAKSRGIENIALFGTSLGGPRVAWYLANYDEPAVRVVGFLASIKSPYLEAQLRMDPPMRAKLDEFLQRCRDLVAQDRGGEPVKFDDWFPGRPLVLTAKSFLSFFGTLEDSNASTIKFTSKAVKCPALVIHGTADEIALRPNAEAIHESLTSAPKRDIIWVEGASHYLTPGWIAETYAKKIADWVSTNMPLTQ